MEPKANMPVQRTVATPAASNTVASDDGRRPEAVIAEQLPRRGATSETEGTRALQPASPALTLSSIRKVFVDCPDPSVREALVRELQASGRFSVVEKQDVADAVLQVFAIRAIGEDKKRVTAALRMIGVSGDTLWPGGRKGPAKQFRGSPNEMANRAVRDLLTAVESNERKE
ncbi:MAG: hypothetical protein ACRD1B_03990 [Thermoanaerobaculia bacterium]